MRRASFLSGALNVREYSRGLNSSRCPLWPEILNLQDHQIWQCKRSVKKVVKEIEKGNFFQWKEYIKPFYKLAYQTPLVHSEIDRYVDTLQSSKT